MKTMAEVREVTPAELHELLASGEAPLLLDVRQPWEAEICSLAGSVLIPLSSLPHRLQELPTARTIAVYCHHGVRSLIAARLLASAGLDAMSLEGGIERWAREMDPEMGRY
jgi:rhodanese-related sulfurtransferase